jgi:DNA repair protein RadC
MVQINFEANSVRESSGKVSCRAPEDIYREMAGVGKLAQEAFFVITLDTKRKIINKHLCGLGLLDQCNVHARETFIHAISDNAAAVILVHNHPSGDPTPSKDDCDMTRRLVEAGRIIGIQVMDHVVIGRPDERQPGYVSIHEAGLVNFGYNN